MLCILLHPAASGAFLVAASEAELAVHAGGDGGVLAAGPAEVIEQRRGQDGSISYYVHYVDCERPQQAILGLQGCCRPQELSMPVPCAGDKRLDEWVSSSRLSELTLRPSAQLDILAPRLCSLPSLSS